ncbi:Arm DNA-binding domain-containing protein [Sphingobium limneticum]|nr:Arm DNA-binding domain-containing protein [Sphingobium limneticum]
MDRPPATKQISIKPFRIIPERFFYAFSGGFAPFPEIAARLIESRQIPGHRFAFGGIFWGNRQRSAGDPPMPLKELEVRYATKRSKDYKLADGQGLYLLVRPTGSRLWRMKYRFDGEEKLLSFGRYPEVTLAQARLRRAEAKLALARGEDPGPKAAAPIVSFEVAAQA